MIQISIRIINGQIILTALRLSARPNMKNLAQLSLYFHPLLSNYFPTIAVCRGGLFVLSW